MTGTAYGHGSYFAGLEDPADLDVLVVTDEDLSREEAAGMVGPLLVDVVTRFPELELDVEVVHPKAMSVVHRAIVETGELLQGEAVAVPPVRALEWAAFMAAVASQEVCPATAALSAIRAVWAGRGRLVTPKSAVPAEAAGGRWEDLARAAWPLRHAPTFEHPDLEAVLEAARWSAAGEAASPAWEGRGWSHRSHRSAVLTIYRDVLTSAELGRLAATPADRTQAGGWAKARVDDDDLAGCLAEIAEIANAYWWRRELTGLEPLQVHRHGPGAVFPGHVDRLPMYPTRAFNVVAMVRPAERGGRLYLDLGGERIEPDLEPGDVVVFDSAYLHGVTKVEAGERIVLVTHVHDAPR